MNLLTSIPARRLVLQERRFYLSYFPSDKDKKGLLCSSSMNWVCLYLLRRACMLMWVCQRPAPAAVQFVFLCPDINISFFLFFFSGEGLLLTSCFSYRRNPNTFRQPNLNLGLNYEANCEVQEALTFIVSTSNNLELPVFLVGRR